MSLQYTAGRLQVTRYEPRDGDRIILRQTHHNDPHEVVGEVTLYCDEIEDALYVLSRAKADRDKKR